MTLNLNNNVKVITVVSRALGKSFRDLCSTFKLRNPKKNNDSLLDVYWEFSKNAERIL